VGIITWRSGNKGFICRRSKGCGMDPKASNFCYVFQK